MSALMRIAVGTALALAAQTADGLAHTPLAACYDNGDGTILCEGGFSDGSSAAGVTMIVRDSWATPILEGRMDENGAFEFEKPRGSFSVLFDAGPGHRIEITGEDIAQ